MLEAALTLLVMALHAVAIVSVLVFERRSPSATLAWLLALMFLPGLGLVFYLLFGTTRARRVAARYARAAEQSRVLLRKYDVHERLREAGDGRVRERAQSLLRQGERLSTTPPSLGNECRMLVDAEAAYASMLEAIEAARDHVHVEFFIVQPDIVGKGLREALVEKARAGVETRVLCDGVGSLRLPADFWKPLRDAGGEAAFFGPVRRYLRPLRRIGNRDRIDFRNHRKIVVTDGRVGFTGGLNLGREYLGLDEERGYWRDTHLRIEGPAALSLQAAFAEDWWTATRNLLDHERYFPDPEGHDRGPFLVQIIDSGPDRRFSPISFVFSQAFALASERIWLTSPYFVPNESVKNALIAASLRGVDVRLLVPLRPDHRIVYLAMRSYFRPLLEAGIRIFLYREGFIHAKTLVVDRWVGTIGSANMDMRSFHLNFELNAFVYGAEFADTLARQFETDLEKTIEYSLANERAASVLMRVLSSGARLLSPLI